VHILEPYRTQCKSRAFGMHLTSKRLSHVALMLRVEISRIRERRSHIFFSSFCDFWLYTWNFTFSAD